MGHKSDGGGAGYIRSCESFYNQFNERVKAIYTQMAEEFADYDEKLLFSGINEIIDENSSVCFIKKKFLILWF